MRTWSQSLMIPNVAGAEAREKASCHDASCCCILGHRICYLHPNHIVSLSTQLSAYSDLYYLLYPLICSLCNPCVCILHQVVSPTSLPSEKQHHKRQGQREDNEGCAVLVTRSLSFFHCFSDHALTSPVFHVNQLLLSVGGGMSLSTSQFPNPLCSLPISKHDRCYPFISVMVY